MQFMRGIFLSTCLVLATTPAWPSTNWIIRGSSALDALCFVNDLTGDKLVEESVFYRDDVAKLKPRLDAKALAALDRLRKNLREGHGKIVGPFLALVLSAAPRESIDGFIEAVRQPRQLKRNFSATQYWDYEGWKVFDSSRPDILTALRGLKAAGFVEYWQESVLPKIAAKAQALRSQSANTDLLGYQEKLVGHSFSSDRIEVILMHFCRPYGIRITGVRYLTDVDYPVDIVLRNAAHEPFHPPFSGTSAMWAALAPLHDDLYVRRVYDAHDRKFSYNSWEAYVEEDSVQALEQLVSEHFRFAIDPALRWRYADGGMHVLAAALYRALKDDRYEQTGGNYEEWLIGAVKSGRLGPHPLEALARRVLEVSAGSTAMPRKP